METGDQAQHHKDEDQAGQVERAHQFAERKEADDAVLANGERHGAKRTNRGQLHDDVDDGKQHVRDFFDEVKHHRAAPAELVKRKSEQHRNQQHLQDFAFGESVNDGTGNDIENEVNGAGQLAGSGVSSDRFGVEGGHVDIHAFAGLEDIDQHNADQQRYRADNLEIQQRQATSFPNFLHVLHARNADHDCAENNRRDDHLDQLDETVSERLHVCAHAGVKVA